MVRVVVIESRSVSETLRIGKRIGRFLQPGDVVALAGDLGAGKTHLIKGLAQGTGIRSSSVSSPSFTLINEYHGRISFYHLDLFRLTSEREVEDLGLEEYTQGTGVTAIEWADKVPSILSREHLWIHLRYTGEKTRSIEICGRGKRYEEVVRRFRSALPEKSRTSVKSAKCKV